MPSSDVSSHISNAWQCCILDIIIGSMPNDVRRTFLEKFFAIFNKVASDEFELKFGELFLEELHSSVEKLKTIITKADVQILRGTFYRFLQICHERHT